MSEAVIRAGIAGWSDEEVVRRILGGEPEFFEILMRRHNGALYRLCRGVLGDAGEAEDVLQEAYWSAYRQLAGFRGEAAPATWLRRIALHTALRRLRLRHRLHLVPASERPEPALRDPRPGPDETAGTRELGRALAAAVEALPDSLRCVFVLREIEGLSSQEVADELGLSNANVRVRLHRARQRLQRGLEQRFGQAVREAWSFDGERCDRLVSAVLAKIGSAPRWTA